ncbi:MAG: tetratricopeptide repeat protein, partial [Gemmatimonadales bacterium]|nr:tetratricopeptide repeat protein [Gemmatimonadales bacterium]
MRPSRLLLAVVLLLGVPTIATGQRARLVIPLEQLEAQAAADSNDARAHYALALACLLKRHNDDAERALREAIAIEPEFAPAHFALAFLPYARRSKLWKEQSRGRVPAEWVPAIEESYRSSRLAFLLDPFVDLKVLLAVVPARKDLGLTKRELSIYIELVKGFEFFW